MITRHTLRAAAALALLTVAAASSAQSAPATGVALFEQMHQAYQGKWYSTLTFVQKTTTRRADGTDSVATWYESLRYTQPRGTQLRIDLGPPSLGNGVLYTADSLWVMKAGQLSATRGHGNALLPLIDGVYMQPAARTAAELATTGVDLSRKPVLAQWEGKTVWIMGVTSAADTVSPRFVVDSATLNVVRAVFTFAPGRDLDARLKNLVRVGGGWLAVRCEFYEKGQLVSTEEYSDWKGNVELPASLFDITQWSTGPHWAAPAK